MDQQMEYINVICWLLYQELCETLEIEDEKQIAVVIALRKLPVYGELHTQGHHCHTLCCSLYRTQVSSWAGRSRFLSLAIGLAGDSAPASSSRRLVGETSCLKGLHLMNLCAASSTCVVSKLSKYIINN